MNEKIKKYLSLYNRANSGDKLSQAEWKFFIEFSHQPDPETVAELQKTKPFEGKTVDETLAMMQDSLVGTLSAPENKKAVLELSEKAEQGKLSDKIGAALNIALVGTDIATSLGQIKAADRQLQKTTRPTKPSPLTEDPLLQQALSDAQRGNYDSVRALAPAQLAILDSYLGDLNNAEVASGGQAGTYGALAQVAATRRGKRSLELAPIVDNIQRENLQRYDQLLGHKLSENQAIQQSQAQF